MIYQFKTKQLLKSDLETVWDFVSSPRNLKKITPPYMGFDITSKDLPLKMYPGMIISYKGFSITFNSNNVGNRNHTSRKT